ncbi:MAG: hypothetical protein OXG08_09840 [Gammaproteobacteria bacterium]|nr:hypothetical protein [Gammaproteobacteria bacterium]
MEDVFLMVVLIVAIGVGGGILGSHLKARRITSRNQLLRRLEVLEKKVGDESVEQRLQALEAIVTDQRSILREKIDAL